MQFHFDKALEILAKTYLFVLLRLAVYTIALAITILWFGGLFLLFQNWPFPGPPWLAWVVGGILYGSGARLVRQYVLYLVKSAHVSVITQLAVGGDLPPGANQLSYGKDVVVKRFLQVSLLFGVDRLVNMVLKAFNRSVFKLIGFIPGIGILRGFARRVLDYSAGYVDEAILSYSLLHPEASAWQSAREGLILYVQNWKTILGSGLILALISYALVAVVAAPGALLSYLFAGAFFEAGIGVSIGLGLLVKFAVMDPFALTSVIVNFHAVTAGQRPDFALESKLEKVSKKYRQIKAHAGSWSPGGSTPPPPPVSPDQGPITI
ncbi:MAG: hypothetical protein ACE5JX_07370 [Acidobacteriota bacterium]